MDRANRFRGRLWPRVRAVPRDFSKAYFRRLVAAQASRFVEFSLAIELNGFEGSVSSKAFQGFGGADMVRFINDQAGEVP